MRRIIVVFMLAALMVMAVAGTAWAKPITYTESQKTAEGPYTDESTLCQDELYSTTFSGHTVEHFTYFEETGVLHYHLSAHAKVVSVPLDGTGPTYTGQTREVVSDIWNVERGELVHRTWLDRFVARGSDGSRAFGSQHVHFIFNANGVKTVDFDKPRIVCSG